MDNFLEDLFSDNQIIPILSVSNKTGQNLSLVHKYIRNLVPRIIWPTPIESSILYVDSKYMVDGIGLIVSGTLRGGIVRTKDNLWMGPVKKNYSGKKPWQITLINSTYANNCNSLVFAALCNAMNSVRVVIT